MTRDTMQYVRFGIPAAPLPPNIALPFASEVSRACSIAPTFSPMVAYAIKNAETDLSPNAGQIEDGGDPVTLLLPDGSQAGLGIFQLTSSFPTNWNDPFANSMWALENFIYPAMTFWSTYGLRSDNLIRAIAASFNAGISGAAAGHMLGDVGTFTTYLGGVSYSDRVLVSFHKLQTGVLP